MTRVRIMIFTPSLMYEAIGSRVKSQLPSMETSTIASMRPSFLAGGMTTAMNMAYSATESALTMSAGRMSPKTIPSTVPTAQPGIVIEASP